jgi:hypothetical protein
MAGGDCLTPVDLIVPALRPESNTPKVCHFGDLNEPSRAPLRHDAAKRRVESYNL